MPDKTYSLRLENPPTGSAGGRVVDVTRIANGWRRSIRANGGPWLGTFRIVNNVDNMLKWYNEHLFYTLRESYEGRTTWKGVVWEMTLTHNGISRRRSLDSVSNYVWALYTDTEGQPQETSTANQAQSVNLYGRMEELLLLDNYPQAAAEQQRDKVLAEFAWPWSRPAGGNTGGDTYLDVTVAGMAFTANNRYVTATSTSTTNINSWVSDIISTDLEFLGSARVDTNTVQVQNTMSIPTRAWDQLMELVSLGGPNTAPWEITVTTDEDDDLIIYREVDTEPLYFIQRQRILDRSMRAVSQWEMRPGVVRDLDYPALESENGSWLENAADLYIKEVVASDTGISWTVDGYSETDIWAAQQDYKLMLEKLQEELGEQEEADDD